MMNSSSIAATPFWTVLVLVQRGWTQESKSHISSHFSQKLEILLFESRWCMHLISYLGILYFVQSWGWFSYILNKTESPFCKTWVLTFKFILTFVSEINVNSKHNAISLIGCSYFGFGHTIQAKYSPWFFFSSFQNTLYTGNWVFFFFFLFLV